MVLTKVNKRIKNNEKLRNTEAKYYFLLPKTIFYKFKVNN